MICSDPEEDPKPPTVNHKEARRLRDKLRKRKQRKNIKERAFLGEVPQDDSFAEVAVARISDRETTSILGIVDNPLDNPPEAVGKTIAMAKTIAMVDKNLEVMSPERPCKIRKICGGVMPPGTYYIGDPSYVLGTPWTRAEVKDLRMNGTLDVLDRAHLLPDGDVPGWTEAYAERVKENEEDAQVKAIEKDAQDQGKFTLSNGREIVVFDTAYGPGLYTDCKGRRYLVQSRSICLTLAEGLDNMQQGNVIEYTEPFECVALVDSRPFSGKRPFSGGRVTIMHFGDEAGIETEFHHRSSVVKGQ